MMITTLERAELLAEHCKKFTTHQFLVTFDLQDLLDWIRLELGHTEVLDRFVEYGSEAKLSMAVPNGPILHILSGNTPHAGIQSLLRGLLIGAMNLVKLPSAGIADVTEWIKELPDELAKLVRTVDDLNDAIFSSAKTVIAIGSDMTMAEIQKRISPRQRFIPHGHKLSIGVVHKPSAKAAELIVQDACAYDQQGCLSLHTVYVVENARGFLPMLAEAMASYEKTDPRSEISISESGAISNLREVVRYDAANDPENAALEHSLGNTNWTVIYRNSPTLIPSPLNRVLSVQPWPLYNQLSSLGSEREYLSTIAVEEPLMERAKLWDVPRICKLGDSQRPSLTWHHDGFTPLASLVRWRDIDT